MARLPTGLKTLLILGLAIHFHLHFHHHPKGPTIDYVGLGGASAASFFGVPGPGEPVLIAAAVFAAKHKLSIGSLIIVAWFGATCGGIIGWLLGLKAGRTVLTTRGPLHKQRLHALERGDALFARFTVLGILLTPSWMAGIHRVPAVKYNLVNTAIAAVWAAGIGYSAYAVGPAVIDAVDDLGTGLSIALGVVVVAVIGEEVIRRRRKKRSENAR